jgi:branched-subunit amino acid transport protein
MTALVSMLVLGAVCWAFRIAFVTIVPAERLPPKVRTSLEHVAPSVLAAIVAVDLVDLLRPAASVQAATLLLASILTGVVAYRTRNLSVVSGLALAVVLVLDLVVLRS